MSQQLIIFTKTSIIITNNQKKQEVFKYGMV